MWLAALWCAWAGEEVRENYDEAGNLSHRIVLVDNQLSREEHYRYAGSLLVEKRSSGPGGETIETWSYAGDRPTLHEQRLGEQLQLKESWTYGPRGVLSRTVERPGEASQITLWTYDALGRVIQTETHTADGLLLSRSLADRSRPVTPVHFEFSAGGGWSSQTEVLDLASGFSLSRKPDASLYDVDPLEFRVGMAYKLSRSQGETVNDDLSAWAGMDYNHIAPRSTLFLFGTVARNPVANLSVDLVVAPVGYKVELIQAPRALLDLSFAPIWNFRSIVAPAGGACDGNVVEADTPCDSSKLRGSFRLRLGYDGVFKISDTVEYIPEFNLKDFGAGWTDGAIFRNSLSIGVKLSKSLRLEESFVYTYDQSLTDQIDCTTESGSLLCQGMMFSNTTSLVFAFDLKK
ncbi:MAG TPA: hypothetical protein PKW90_00455 [Myxococcota bacterium]|nr:hypothetical protein [Myxococcota bacterium]